MGRLPKPESEGVRQVTKGKKDPGLGSERETWSSETSTGGKRLLRNLETVRGVLY